MRFPVLRINPSHMLKFKSPRELRIVSQNYLEHGGFRKDAFFIDSAGYRFELIDVIRRRKSLNPFIQIMRPSPAIVVDVELGEPIQLSLEDVKKTVIELVVEKGWYSQGHQNESTFRNMIERCRSVAEVTANISFYGKWQG